MSPLHRRPGPRDPLTTVLVLVLYVVPVTGAVVLLLLAGLPELALALAVVEAVVATAVVLAERPAREPRRPAPAGRGGLVLVGLLVIVLGIAGVSLLAAQIG